MDRKEVIDTLLAAKAAHMQWRARAQALVAGIHLDKDQVPVMCTDCKFGKWYYGEGQRLSKYAAFEALEDPHRELHLVYLEMFNHLFGEDRRSGWAKLFGSKKAHRKREMAAAEALLPRLVGISQTLLEAVDLLASEINSASDEELEAL